jgi:hypothetical protein
MVLSRFSCVVSCVQIVSVCDMSVMCAFFVRTRFVMSSGFLVMLSCVLVLLSSFLVMFCSFVPSHLRFSCLDFCRTVFESKREAIQMPVDPQRCASFESPPEHIL